MENATFITTGPQRTKWTKGFFAASVSSLLLCTALFSAGCPKPQTPLERQTYKTVVSSNAFIKKMKSLHPECNQSATSVLCSTLEQATAAKDALIDATEVYCASPDFDANGTCTPPAKGTPASDQATAKLRAALQNYDRFEADLRKAAGQ